MKGFGDFDGDRILDIVWQNLSGGSVVIWYMNADCSRKRYKNIIGSTAWQIRVVRNIDDDGIGDVVWQYHSTGKVVV